jgi:hypothetical protein
MDKKYLLIILGIVIEITCKAQNFTEIIGTTFEAVHYSSIAFADIDGDNDQDVLITGENNSYQCISKLYSNDGNGVYSEIIGTPFVGVSFGSVAFSDVDGDDDLDLLITGYNCTLSIAELYINDGAGNFSLMSGTPFDGVHKSSIAFSDVDGDNDQDVLITGFTNGSQRIAKLYTNDGSGSFTLVTGTPFSGVWTSSIAFSDVDGDNDDDLLITGRNSSNQRISELYLNDGNGMFSLDISSSFEGVSTGSVAFSDIDGDNDNDLLITGYTNLGQYITYLYRNDGFGSFNLVSGTPFDGVSQSSIQFADIDNDNDQDVLISGLNYLSATARSQLYRNDGNGNFVLVAPLSLEDVYYSSISFTDIDGDNDQDLLITGRDSSGQGGVAKLYENDLISVGVKENQPIEDLFIYPNPGTNYLYITVSSDNQSGRRMIIYNTIGEIVFATILEKEIMELKINDFDKGIYFIELVSDKGEKTMSKFIKN